MISYKEESSSAKRFIQMCRFFLIFQKLDSSDYGYNEPHRGTSFMNSITIMNGVLTVNMHQTHGDHVPGREIRGFLIEDELCLDLSTRL